MPQASAANDDALLKELPAWHADLFDRLLARQVGGYQVADPPATEPTALCALAILAVKKFGASAATDALSYLNRAQSKDGSVGVQLAEPTPGWPTSLAVLAWELAARLAPERTQFDARINAAVHWILGQRGETSLPDPDIGHDSGLVAWSWAPQTHAWIEPTSLHVLALKGVGKSQHARTREAIKMLVDRQLPSGGCNYGNTFVLGQMLRPHVEPTGLLTLALMDETDASGRLAKSLDYLSRTLSASTPPVSLAWGLLGLTAHGRRPAAAEDWLERAYERVVESGESPYKLALIAHASLGERSPLIALPRGTKA